MKILLNIFSKNPIIPQDSASRERYGTLAGTFGIISNIILFVLKIIIGLISGSISVIADAINNLSDSGTSILTIVGFKLSTKPADEDHPYGHARMEYLTGLGISVIIIAIGFELLTNSFGKILNPELPSYGIPSFVVLVLSIIIKIIQAILYKKVGRIINSKTLKATFTDSINDAITTTVILISTIISFFFSIPLDGFVGLLMSGFIIVSGIKLVIETANPLLGTAPCKELVETIVEKLQTYDIVLGIHDLVIHSYGNEKCFASVHVEIDANCNFLHAHDMIDIIERDFQSELGISLVIHPDPIVTDSPELAEAKAVLTRIIKNISPDISLHDFRAVFGKTHTNIIFDICVPFSIKHSEDELKNIIDEETKKINPNWFTVVTVDRDFNNYSPGNK